ncbi:MAG: protein kinase [Anaerolineae bacterium]|nr:protein kinase [Anaerolineae bacterium]
MDNLLAEILGLALVLGIITFIFIRFLHGPSKAKRKVSEEEKVLVTYPSDTGKMLVDAHSPRLVAEEGPLSGRKYPIPPPPKGLTMGRDNNNDIVLAKDTIISRLHAQIMQESDAYVIYDRDSTNGVFINNQRVMRHPLTHGDLIQIGSSAFRYLSKSEQDEASKKPVTPPGPSFSDAPSINTTYFEGYLLEKELGRGGMSVVYKARNPEGQVVAVKIFNPTTDKYLVKKFKQEGEIGRALRNHPNICKVENAGQSKDHYLYMVMEFINGKSLREFVNKYETLTEGQIVRIIGQVCDALHYAHLQHVVHRDIKPENIMVDENLWVKVVDFGIAKLTSSVTVTRTRIVGTPQYISPEQARAERIYPSSDIYSLGVVLYELLTGKPPFPMPYCESPTHQRNVFNEVLSAHIHKKPAPLNQLRPEIPENLAKVALKALEKSPQQRFASAWEMAQAIGFQRDMKLPTHPERVLQGSLVVMQGPQNGQRFTLGKKVIILGRDQIAPGDGYISRKHFFIEPRGNQLWLEDTSRNGTWVNGERVYGATPVKGSDIITIGNYTLRIET